MTVTYTLMDPTGNLTVLAETPVPAETRAAVASRLMELEPAAEQVGFLSRENGMELQMAGGEFCGNATMSAAVLRCIREGVTGGAFQVIVSGAGEPVNVTVSKGQEGLWRGTVDMPRALAIEERRLDGETVLPVVTFPGISHVILEREMPRDRAERLAKQWCGTLGADALGLMFLDRGEMKLTPLVYVPGADTLFWESACGSGTAAVGAWMAGKTGEPVRLALRQPGGVLELFAAPAGTIRLTGTVRLVRERTAAIEL